MKFRLCTIFLVFLLFGSFPKSYACEVDEKIQDIPITVSDGSMYNDFCTQRAIYYPAINGKWVAHSIRILGNFENEYNFFTNLEMKDSSDSGKDGKKFSLFCVAEGALKKIRIEIEYVAPPRTDGKFVYCLEGETIVLEDFLCDEKSCTFKQSKDYLAP